MEVLGVPDPTIVNKAQRKKLFFGELTRTRTLVARASSHIRHQRRAPSIRQCQGQAPTTRLENPRTGAEVQRRAIYRLYLEMPYLGS